MTRLLLAIPMGETVRNVLRTDTFAILRSAPDLEILILTQGADDEEFRREFEAPNVRFEKLHEYRPGFSERLLQRLRLRVLRQKCSTIAICTEPAEAKALQQVTRWIDSFVAVAGYQRLYNLLDKLDGLIKTRCSYEEIFRAFRPELVAVTRVLSWSADFPVLKHAASLDLPVVALVASWDNLTSKAFFPVGVKHLVVWNDIQRAEAVELFNFDPARIFISGIPRFDCYFRREGLRSRGQYFAAMGLDPDKRLLTYATGHDRIFSPHESNSLEPVMVEFLAETVEAGRFGEPCQLLVRLHPQASPSAYEPITNRYPVKLQIPGRSSVFRDRDLSTAENRLLAETMWHSDVVINIASTITIDAAAFDTTVVCVGVDIAGERPYLKSVRRFYDFDHYRKLATAGGFRRADTREALIEEIRRYLSDPSRDREGRKRIIKEQCAFDDGRCGERVARHILGLLQEQCRSVPSVENPAFLSEVAVS